jgi:hypothetical protein
MLRASLDAIVMSDVEQASMRESGATRMKAF